MEVRRQLNVNQMLVGAAFVLITIAASWLVLFQESETVLFLGGGLVILFIFMRPVIGLALYLLIYPMVPADELITPMKTIVFGLTVLLLFAWLVQKIMRRERFFSKPEYMWLYLFFIFLCFSPIVGMYNDFTPTDWARDIAPLLNLLLLPVIVDYIEKKNNGWLLYLAFVPVGIGFIRDLSVLIDRQGIPLPGLNLLAALPVSSIHPSLGLCLGLLMFLHKAPHRRYWLALAVISLGVAFLTPTRTVWITTGTMILLLLAFNFRKKLWVILSIVLLMVLLGVLSFATSSKTYVSSQQDRFQGLVGYKSNLSYQNRMEEMEQAGELFMSSPLIGVGFGYQYDFWRPFVEGIGPGYWVTNFTHNDIMFIASKGGLTGLLLFCLMVVGIMKKLLHRRKGGVENSQYAWATIAILCLINCLIIGLSTPILQTRSAMFYLTFLLSMGLSKKQNGRTLQ